MKDSPGLFGQVLGWLRGSRKPLPAEQFLDFHATERRAEPHNAGIAVMEDLLFDHLNEVLDIEGMEDEVADRDGNSLPLADHVRETGFIAGYTMDTAARLEVNPNALDGALHRAIRGQSGTRLAKRYAKAWNVMTGDQQDPDDAMKAAIRDIIRAEVAAQHLAASPQDYTPFYDLVAARIGIEPTERIATLREITRELQTFARKIPTMFEQLKADDPNL
jgi:hypothetical protein